MIFERGHFTSTSISESYVIKSLNESRSFKAPNYPSSISTVFLSHKHSDLQDLRGVVGLLQQNGANVYIDSMDNQMPGQTSGETAMRLKSVIKHCRKFVLLASEKAIESYWCNWELGIGDTHRYIENIAILPMKEKGERDYQYKGNEYLQIYPSIDYYDGTTFYRSGLPVSRGYYFCKPRNEEGIRIITPLKDWINS